MAIPQSAPFISQMRPATTFKVVQMGDTPTSTTSTTVSITNMPLTTIFTPAPSCTNKLYTYYEVVSNISTFWREMNIAASSTGNATSCYPESYWYQHLPSVTAQYSPGICPSGYVADAIVQSTDKAVTSWCCPSGMDYRAGYGCASTVTYPTMVISSDTTTSITTAFVAVDWVIQVAWNSSDLDKFTPASAPITATVSQQTLTSALAVTGTVSAPAQTAGPISATTSSSTSSTPSSSSSSSPTLLTSPTSTTPEASAQTAISAEAIIGIAVGPVLAVLLLLIGAFFLWRKISERNNRRHLEMHKRKWHQYQADHQPPYAHRDAGIYAAYGYYGPDRYASQQAEMDGSPNHREPAELHAEKRLGEIKC